MSGGCSPHNSSVSKVAHGFECYFLETRNYFLKSTPYFHNVYLVDGFDTNLIYFGQLVTNNGMVGQITDKLLLLHDRIMRTLIGMGERERERGTVLDEGC